MYSKLMFNKFYKIIIIDISIRKINCKNVIFV